MKYFIDNGLRGYNVLHSVRYHVIKGWVWFDTRHFCLTSEVTPDGVNLFV